MAKKAYADMTVEDLQKSLSDLKGELFNLRFQLATGQLQNPMQIKECKKNIARVHTEIRIREISAAKAE